MRGSGSRRRRRGKVGRRGFRSGRTYLHATRVSAGALTDQGRDGERERTSPDWRLPLFAPRRTSSPSFPPSGSS